MSDVSTDAKSAIERRIKDAVREIPDFPEEGVLYRDITPILHDNELFRDVTNHLTERYQGEGIDHIAAIESRGFIFGSALAHDLGASMSLVRKPGKLPRAHHRVEYELEYGTDALELHEDAVAPDSNVLVVDDLLATGGTARASIELVEKCGAEVAECAFIIELADLEGRSQFGDYDVYSLAIYDG
jgi:adenine phosphoribosyltransferase